MHMHTSLKYIHFCIDASKKSYGLLKIDIFGEFFIYTINEISDFSKNIVYGVNHFFSPY